MLPQDRDASYQTTQDYIKYTRANVQNATGAEKDIQTDRTAPLNDLSSAAELHLESGFSFFVVFFFCLRG